MGLGGSLSGNWGVSAATQYPGAASNLRAPWASFTVAQGASASIPGPAEGYVRVFTSILVGGAGGTTSTQWQIYTDPGGVATAGLLIKREVSIATTVGPGSNAALASGFTLAYGERLLVSNPTAAVQTATCFYQYLDLAASTYTVVRKALTDTTPVSTIPAAATGYANRVVWAGPTGPVTLGRSGGPSPLLHVFNDDSVSAQIEVFSASTYLGRTGALTAQIQMSLINLPPLLDGGYVTTEAMSLALRAAVTTGGRSVNVCLVYETLRL